MINLSSPVFLKITAHVKHYVPSVHVRNDTLIWVKSGQKKLFSGENHATVNFGSAVLLPRDTQWDVVNDPFPAGVYLAEVLEFGDTAISLFYDKHGADFEVRPVMPGSVIQVDTQLAEALRACFRSQSCESTSLRIKIHKVVEVLILLAERGVVFLPRDTLSMADRVRRLISQAPHAEWNLRRISKVFNVSESTLRRRLKSFGVTVFELVNEVRLGTALTLLQSTELPVGEISRRCGYESHSRFSAAFRQRFGFAPSHLRSPRSSSHDKESAQNLTVYAQRPSVPGHIIESSSTLEVSNEI